MLRITVADILENRQGLIGCTTRPDQMQIIAQLATKFAHLCIQLRIGGAALDEVTPFFSDFLFLLPILSCLFSFLPFVTCADKLG